MPTLRLHPVLILQTAPMRKRDGQSEGGKEEGGVVCCVCLNI